jgi:hypothetical protein
MIKYSKKFMTDDSIKKIEGNLPPCGKHIKSEQQYYAYVVSY